MAAPPSASTQPVTIVPATNEEEDIIVLSRITNDERPLKRVVRKFSAYAALAFPPAGLRELDTAPTTPEKSLDAREALLVELGSFGLHLRKAAMVCAAEARQVEEYHLEKARIEEERVALRRHIEQLKTTLEEAQVERAQKQEYDQFAERINQFPSRAERERMIAALENDIAVIREERNQQQRAMQEQRKAFVSVIGNLAELQTTMRERVSADSDEPPAPPTNAPPTAAPSPAPPPPLTAIDTDEREEGEADVSSDEAPLSATLNPRARQFIPRGGLPQPTRVLRSSASSTPAPQPTPPAEDDDIEMGEVAEPGRSPRNARGKRRLEELEEGEASELSELSELSD
ncbi:hypothetical protein PENSPDRAFT_730509 [Peniophora sp. CONT]|nr:hypothetical protein PENSPDRAFT_730509 [Peniophora sp. CONT]